MLILLGIIAVSVVMCGVVPFWLMPKLGVAVALPVIMVPGEVVWEDFLGISGLTVTNTLIGTLVADVLVLIFAFGAVRKMSAVPGRWQGLFEVLTDALYGLAKSTAGPNARRIFPLMATIFLFLLIANWIKLVPGAESIGLMHCAADGINGYERNGILLKVDEPMDPGTRATQADYDACHHAEEEEHAEEGEDVALDEAEGEPGEGVEGEQSAIEPTEEAGTAPRDDLYAVTPFLRGAATDLNLALGLGLIAFVAIQYFGVRALGIGYFAKFLNTPALENAAKRPMGIMDFVVGLLELVLEFAKIISFGFRLFGNLFAGGVLLFVMSFLVSMLVPAAVYVLELFVGLIQAFVFSMLLLIFSSVAMQGHGSEHHEAEH
ncbi:MAG: FoF1 ATP synthase subunit a [Chloroflexota bacterium]|nr:F0F1 ATP synthase subunit A [Anaerolineae bacterium]